MTEYKLDPRFFSTLRRRALLIGIPFVIFGLSLGFYAAGRNDPRPMPWFLWAAVVLGALIASAIGVFGGMQRAMRSWSSLRIVLDEEGVTLVRDHANIRIPYGEITRINMARDGLAIRTASRFRYIVVPKMLERFDEFRLELARRHAIDEVPPVQAARNIALIIAALVLMLAVVVVFFVATNRYVVIAASIGILLMATYMVVARRKGLLAPLGRFQFWFMVIFLAVMAIGRMIFAALGY